MVFAWYSYQICPYFFLPATEVESGADVWVSSRSSGNHGQGNINVFTYHKHRCVQTKVISMIDKTVGGTLVLLIIITQMLLSIQISAI